MISQLARWPPANWGETECLQTTYECWNNNSVKWTRDERIPLGYQWLFIFPSGTREGWELPLILYAQHTAQTEVLWISFQPAFTWQAQRLLVLMIKYILHLLSTKWSSRMGDLDLHEIIQARFFFIYSYPRERWKLTFTPFSLSSNFLNIYFTSYTN